MFTIIYLFVCCLCIVYACVSVCHMYVSDSSQKSILGSMKLELQVAVASGC